MIVAFSVAPSGTGRADGSVSDAVAAAVRIVRDSGLPHRTSSMFTELEGTWDECFDVVKRATEAVLPFGSRVSLVLKADIRPGYEGQIDSKLERLEAATREAGRPSPLVTRLIDPPSNRPGWPGSGSPAPRTLPRMPGSSPG